MKKFVKAFLVTLLFLSLASAVWAMTLGPGESGEMMAPTSDALSLSRVGSLRGSGAEIAAYDAVSQTLFVVTGGDFMEVINISDPTSPTLQATLPMTPYGAGANSVAVYNGIVATAVASTTKQAPGSVVFFDRDGNYLNQVSAGALPDMLIFTPDGSKVLVANEGEPNDAYDNDPEGSISVVDLSNGVMSATVQTLDFTAFNSQKQALLDSGVRIFGGVESYTVITYTNTDPAVFTIDGEASATWVGMWATLYAGEDPIPYQVAMVDEANDVITLTDEFDGDTDPDTLETFNLHAANATVAQDIEPEYIAVSPDGNTAWVTLQENNALAIVDLQAMTVTQVLPLGYKNHSLSGNALDASDKDDMINIQNWPTLGMYMPDAITAFEIAGEVYLITANEGDSREYERFIEESRVKDVPLDATAFPNANDLQASENLGRLKNTLTKGDTDGDGDFDAIYSFGARSFSIWAADGSQVYDSGSALEETSAVLNPTNFNADEGEFDGRSDDKGPEPEGVTKGVLGGRTYAFIGLERTNEIMVYDVTSPTMPIFVQYVPAEDGDAAPEGLLFISAEESPNGHPLLVVTYEDSGTTTVFQIDMPKLSVEKTVETATDPVQLGDIVTYTIVVSNSGALPAAGVVVTDQLPIMLESLAFIEGGSSIIMPIIGDSFTWETPQVPVNTQFVIRFTAVVSNNTMYYGQTATNIVTYTSDNAGMGTDEASFILESIKIFLPLVMRNY